MLTNESNRLIFFNYLYICNMKQKAKEKIQLAENAWNSQNPELVSKAYTIDSEWRNAMQVSMTSK